jgi:hypothetical protein
MTQGPRHAPTRLHSAPKALSAGTVVLLHGWWSGAYFLRGTQWWLKARGFEVVALGYPSARMPAADLARRFLPSALEGLGASGDRPLHFVTHSMGRVLLRGMLLRHRPPNLGRVVMLGPPNRGSEAADFWGRSRILRRIAGPNLVALGTGTESFARTLPPVDFPLLVIAGDRPLSPFWSPLPHPHDGRVTVESTRVEGMTAHCVLHSTHSMLPWSRTALDLTTAFLRTGRVDPSMP